MECRAVLNPELATSKVVSKDKEHSTVISQGKQKETERPQDFTTSIWASFQRFHGKKALKDILPQRRAQPITDLLLATRISCELGCDEILDTLDDKA